VAQDRGPSAYDSGPRDMGESRQSSAELVDVACVGPMGHECLFRPKSGVLNCGVAVWTGASVPLVVGI
jgi:hypothetical protein